MSCHRINKNIIREIKNLLIKLLHLTKLIKCEASNTERGINLKINLKMEQSERRLCSATSLLSSGLAGAA